MKMPHVEARDCCVEIEPTTLPRMHLHAPWVEIRQVRTLAPATFAPQ